MRKLSGDCLLWNWARWCWTGETVGNMQRYIPWEDNFNPINIEHARAVNVLYERLPRHEAMVIQAEYTRKSSHFGEYSSSERVVVARRWIKLVTGAVLRDEDYRRHLEAFKATVEKEIVR